MLMHERRKRRISAGVRNPVVRSGATMVRAYSPFWFCLSHSPGLRPGLAWIGPPALFQWCGLPALIHERRRRGSYQPACAILFSGRAPLWCGRTALSCSACLISRGFAPGWHGSGLRPSSDGADCRCSCMSAENAGHISRRAQSCGQVGRHYAAGLQPFLVLPVSFPGASPRAGMGRASGPLQVVRIAGAHA